MKLHKVITEVLEQSGESLTCREIADRVNRSGLYKSEVAVEQISARINSGEYCHLFKKDKTLRPMLISLSD